MWKTWLHNVILYGPYQLAPSTTSLVSSKLYFKIPVESEQYYQLNIYYCTAVALTKN